MKVNRKKFVITILILVLLAIIAGSGLWIINSRAFEERSAYNIADIENFLKLPEPEQANIIDSTRMNVIETPPVESTMEEASAENAGIDTVTGITEQPSQITETESNPPEEFQEMESTETPENTVPPEVNVNVEEIEVPGIQPELGGGSISISGTIALEQAYYEEHDLQKAQKLARDILKNNPSDPTARKILQLIELESKGNQALKAGDFQTAIMYFQKMQEIDPNNIWAKKGIIRAQSGR